MTPEYAQLVEWLDVIGEPGPQGHVHVQANKESLRKCASAIRRLSGEVERLEAKNRELNSETVESSVRYLTTKSQLSQARELLDNLIGFGAHGNTLESCQAIDDARTFLNTQSEPEKSDA